MMTFGEWVRHRRRLLGLTQEQLIARLDPGQQSNYISKVESGIVIRRLPEPDQAQRWVDALETTMEDLLSSVGYLGESSEDIAPEIMFTSLAEEIGEIEDDVVREAGLDGLRTVRRLWESKRKTR